MGRKKVITIAKEFSKSFYKSKAWRKCRESYISHVYGLCERCQEPGLILHHKVLLTAENINNPDITLNWNHLEYLCLTCHNQEHGAKEEGQRYKFDSNGNIIPL